MSTENAGDIAAQIRTTPVILSTVVGLFSLTLYAFGVIVNFLILLAPYKNTALRKKCNILIAVMALADTLISADACVHSALILIRIFGISQYTCMLITEIGLFSIALGAMMSFSLGVDRFAAVQYPIWYKFVSSKSYILAHLAFGCAISGGVAASCYVAVAAAPVTRVVFVCAVAPATSGGWDAFLFVSSFLTFLIAGLALNIAVFLLIRQQMRELYPPGSKYEPPKLSATRMAAPSMTQDTSFTGMRGNDHQWVSKEHSSVPFALKQQRLQVSLLMIAFFNIIPRLFIPPWVFFVENAVSLGGRLSREVVKELGLSVLANISISANFFIFYHRSEDWRTAFRTILRL